MSTQDNRPGIFSPQEEGGGEGIVERLARLLHLTEEADNQAGQEAGQREKNSITKPIDLSSYKESTRKK